jgi:hypothetical protein
MVRGRRATRARRERRRRSENRNDTAIESDEGSVVKESLTLMMKTASHLLVIVGQKTHTSKWVNWGNQTR